MNPNTKPKKEHTHDKFGLQLMRDIQHDHQKRPYRVISEFVTLQRVNRDYNPMHLSGYGGHTAVAVFNDKAGKMHKFSLRQLRRQLRLAQHEAKAYGEDSRGAKFVELASPAYAFMQATLNNRKPDVHTSASAHAKRLTLASLQA